MPWDHPGWIGDVGLVHPRGHVLHNLCKRLGFLLCMFGSGGIRPLGIDIATAGSFTGIKADGARNTRQRWSDTCTIVALGHLGGGLSRLGVEICRCGLLGRVGGGRMTRRVGWDV